MKQAIKLENTNFVLAEIVNSLPDTLRVMIWHNAKIRNLPDFGTILVGQDTITEDIFDMLVSPSETILEPLLCCPSHWRMPQLLKALGAFKSSTAASKNGWDMDIPIGFSQHLIRLNNVKGVITIFKRDNNIVINTDDND